MPVSVGRCVCGAKVYLLRYILMSELAVRIGECALELTEALSGMKRSPRQSTSREVIPVALVFARSSRGSSSSR